MWNEPLVLLDVTYPTLAENLAFDEALLTTREAQSGAGVLRLWECPETAVALGRSSRVDDHVHLDECRRDGVPLVRRASGGGVVVVGRGCLEYSLFLPVETGGHRIGLPVATRTILARLSECVRPALSDAGQAGTSDLAIGGRKVSGNAQRWLSRMLLHHGTLLYEFPIEMIARYVKLPPDQPEYRAGRTHEDFVANLPVSRDWLKQRLAEVWSARAGSIEVSQDTIEKLLSTRYRNHAWNLRR